MSDMKMDMSHDITDGEVCAVDISAGKVTIKHGTIKIRDKPGMTMAFQVKDKALLEKAKAGDKIKFTVLMDN